MSKKQTEFQDDRYLQLVAPVAFQRVFVDWTGSISAALMLSQIVYWVRRTRWDRWIYKTEEEWEDELGLTSRQQKKARILLKRSGLVEIKRDGMPAKLYYRLHENNFRQKCAEFWRELVHTKGTNKFTPKVRTSSHQRYELQTKTTDIDYNICPPGVPPVAGEVFLSKAAKHLARYLESTIRQRQNLRQHRKVLQWLLLKDLAGDKARLKRVLRLFIKTPHDKYTPRVFSVYDFRKKFPKIEAWVNQHEPPPPMEEYSVEVVKTVRHK